MPTGKQFIQSGLYFTSISLRCYRPWSGNGYLIGNGILNPFNRSLVEYVCTS